MSQLSDPQGQQFQVVPKRTPQEVAELLAGQAASPDPAPTPRPKRRKR